jgi:hypothetical protein
MTFRGDKPLSNHSRELLTSLDRLAKAGVPGGSSSPTEVLALTPTEDPAPCMHVTCLVFPGALGAPCPQVGKDPRSTLGPIAKLPSQAHLIHSKMAGLPTHGPLFLLFLNLPFSSLHHPPLATEGPVLPLPGDPTTPTLLPHSSSQDLNLPSGWGRSSGQPRSPLCLSWSKAFSPQSFELWMLIIKNQDLSTQYFSQL